MTGTVKTRAYRSPLREEGARRTRVAVIEAARDLFIENGYGASSIARIAARAGVSAETIYAVFGTKVAILSAAIDFSIAGDDEPTPILDRPWVIRMRTEQDPEKRLRQLAAGGARILQRITPMYGVLKAGADADPRVRKLLAKTTAERFAGQEALLRIALDGAPLLSGVRSADAIDVLFAIGSPDVYRSLTGDRGWSGRRFVRWYGDALVRLFLDPSRT